MRIQASMRRSQFQRVGGQSLNKGRCPLSFPRYQQNRPSSAGILNLSPRRFASPPCYPTNCFNYDGSLVNSPTRFACRATKHRKKGEKKKKKKQTRDERWWERERVRKQIGEEKEEGSTIIMNRVRERVYPQPVSPFLPLQRTICTDNDVDVWESGHLITRPSCSLWIRMVDVSFAACPAPPYCISRVRAFLVSIMHRLITGSRVVGVDCAWFFASIQSDCIALWMPRQLNSWQIYGVRPNNAYKRPRGDSLRKNRNKNNIFVI